jgi:tetratricopeptide (TPR) repeat protein
MPAKAGFVMDANAVAAYQAIFDLRFPEAKRLIQAEKAKNPNNGITILLENYLDYLYLITSENKSDYEKFKDRKGDRIDAIRENDKNSPYYLFAQAEVYMQWGMLKAKFGDYTPAILDLMKSKKLLAENNERFKDFLPNQKSIGWIDLIFGAIPPSFKGIASIFGIKGDMNAGFKRIERFKSQIANSKYNYYDDEVAFLVSLTEIDVLNNKKSYSKLMALINDMGDRSLLKKYLQGYVAYKTAHNDEAIGFLMAAPRGNEYLPFPAINYWLGNAKLCRMDSDANRYLLNYISETQSVNFIKDAYLKLAYHSLLNNNLSGYNNYVKLIKAKGAASYERDKQALKEANEVKPDLDILKARLYFDGGYYSNALAEIKSTEASDLKNTRDKIELYYRLGRIYELTGKLTDALVNYQKAINMGTNTTYYFAANSALFSGNIYEQRKDYVKAGEYYKLTLKMKDHQYQTSIDNQAKEGLKRIKVN